MPPSNGLQTMNERTTSGLPCSRRALLTGSAIAVAGTALPGFAQNPGSRSTPVSITRFRDVRRLALDGPADVLLAGNGSGACLINHAGETTPLRAPAAINVRHPASPQYTDAAAADNGDIALLDPQRREIHWFDGHGTFQRRLSLPDIATRPAALLYKDKMLWVVDSVGHRVIQLRRNGLVRRIWGGDPTSRRSLNRPIALSMLPDNSLHIVDAGHRRISVWTADGRLMGDYASDLGAGVQSIAADEKGHNLLVLDRGLQQVMAYSDSGGELGSAVCGEPGSRHCQPFSVVSHARNKGFYVSV